MMKKSKLKTAVALAALSASSLPAFSQETIRLTIASGFPPVLPFVAEAVETFVPTVNEELAKTGNYEIKWTEAHAGSLVSSPEILQATTDGIVDIAVMGHVFEPAKLPLMNVGGAVPFGATDIEVASETLIKLNHELPEFEAEWDAVNAVYLTGWANGNYYLLSTKPIETVEGLNGVKIGATPGQFPWFTGIGAVGVTASYATAYNDLSSGIYDVILTALAGAVAANLHEVAPYVIETNLGAVNSGSIVVNKDKWGELPEEVQNALKVAADAWLQGYYTRMATLNESAMDALEGGSATLVAFSDEERAKWAASLPPLGKEWVARMEENGLPGQKVLTAYMDYLREHSDDVVRDWDKE
ncbi:MAG: C4-dicarboxylate TRAP transporter substrate-binding protein [Pseudomonadota bacterium]|nr:C4-dicarboxylate TRAP transporter substrate-binding protein [Pseudomonadota bacterium]